MLGTRPGALPCQVVCAPRRLPPDGAGRQMAVLCLLLMQAKMWTARLTKSLPGTRERETACVCVCVCVCVCARTSATQVWHGAVAPDRHVGAACASWATCSTDCTVPLWYDRGIASCVPTPLSPRARTCIHTGADSTHSPSVVRGRVAASWVGNSAAGLRFGHSDCQPSGTASPLRLASGGRARWRGSCGTSYKRRVNRPCWP